MKSVVIPIGALETGTSSANDLNESSEAIGSRDAGGSNRTAKWDAANNLTLQFSTSITQGVANNNNGEFVGTNGSGSTGYFANNPSSRTTLPGSFIPTDINDQREIVGAVGDMAALLDFDTNTTTLLGKLSFTDTYSRALGINADGRIVGISEGTGAFI